MRPVIINPCGGSPLQPPSPAKGTKRKMQAWEHGPSSGGSQLQAGPVSPAEQPRAWGTPRPQPPAAAGYCSPSRAKIGLLNYCMQMDNRKEKRTGMNCARRKTEAHTRKINYSAVTFQLWLTVIWTKTKKHLSWWRQKNLLVLQNNRYNCLGEKKKKERYSKSATEGSPSLPPTSRYNLPLFKTETGSFLFTGNSPWCKVMPCYPATQKTICRQTIAAVNFKALFKY